jgi:transposase
MSDLFWLSPTQMRRIEPYFPLSHGVARVDDRKVISGIMFVIRNGLRWRDAPKEYGPHKTIYNRFIRWSRLGVFNKIFAALAAKGGKPDQLMIDAFPKAKALLGDKGYDADWFPLALTKRGITPCIPSKGQPQGPDRLRQDPLPPAPQDREHVRQAQRLATHPHPLRPLRPYLHVRHLHRGNRHLLALINEA